MYVVVGASGYFGMYFIKNILKYTDAEILATYSTTKPEDIESQRLSWIKLDVADDNCIRDLQNKLESKRAKFIYLSAYHHPDKVELNPRLAWSLNVASLDSFLNKLKQNIETLYYASSDSVYGESVDENPFTEGDGYNPKNTYGRTKAIAEQLVLMHGFNVARYSLLMGASLLKNKKHFFDQIVETVKNGQKIDMLQNSSRTPIDFDQASYFTIQLCEKYPSFSKEIINIAGDQHLTKYDLAIKIINHFNLDESKIVPAKLINGTSFEVDRAKNTLICNKKLKKILNLSYIEPKW